MNSYNYEEHSVSSGDRPISRRGATATYRQSSALKTTFNKSNSAMRPGSAYRGGTASRLMTASATNPSPVPRVGTAFGNMSMMDRPITQQGLSGLRTGTAMARQRQLRDKRYWEEILNGRVKALRLEIMRLNKKVENAAREMSANKHYEARGRELAQQLTDLQGRLADYNLAAQLITVADITSVQKQTVELSSTNSVKSNELESIFAERQKKENQLKQVMEQMNKEQNIVDSLVNGMSQLEKERYLEIKETADKLRSEANISRDQLINLMKDKDFLQKQISMSQMKMQMVDLLRKLFAVEQKRTTIQNEMNSKLKPAQERDQLLIQVREDNAAISSIESSCASIQDEIKRTQDLLDQADQDLEEGQSERHQKFRELKKREETMENFMSNFESNMKEEKTKIERLQNDIVFALEHVSSNIDQLHFDELDTLKQKHGVHNINNTYSNEGEKTVESLTKEYGKLQEQMKKVQSTKERYGLEMNTLPEKINELKQSVESLSDLERLKNEGANKKRELKEQLATVREKITPTENAVEEATRRYKELQKHLDGNEMYYQLNALEEKLAAIEITNLALRDDISSITTKIDYEPVKSQVLDVLQSINGKLQSSVNPYGKTKF